MSSSQQFPSGLNNWVDEDKPIREDFVRDNRLLDENTLWKTDYDADGSVAQAGGIPAYVLNTFYPVGSYYFTDNPQNPATYFHFGEWERAAIGKMLIGVDVSDTDFSSAGKTGGSKTAIAEHTHTIPILSGTAAGAGNHTHIKTSWLSANAAFVMHTPSGSGSQVPFTTSGGVPIQTSLDTSYSGNHSHPVTTLENTTGTKGGTNSLNPFETAYIWKRIA